MIGTIRKHSKWLWWFIAGATVISFIYWGVSPTARNGGIGGNGNYGIIYGHKITEQEYENAQREFYLFYWFNNGEWPNRNPNLKDQELQEQIYVRMMIDLKAADLGIHVSDAATYAEASRMLRSPQLARALGVNSQDISVEMLVKEVLQPEGLTADDFERFVRDNLIIEELVETMGLTGELITPQEAAAIYAREHQEVDAQAVFFSASNYLSQVAVTPAAVAQFYTNDLAEYRLPDRVQVSYVDFNITNFLSQARAELTNLDDLVEMNYNRLGPDYFADANTPEAAKAKIRDLLVRQRALADAQLQANDFANAVFNETPMRPDNLAAIAKQKGLAMHVTAPFSELYGPAEFDAPEAFTKSAFGLTSDDPFAGPILGPDGVYVMALDKQLPSEIPSLDSIRDQVTHDYQMQQAAMIAQRDGTNFVSTLDRQLAAGNSFAAACIAAGQHPEVLPPFSLSTPQLPELANRAGFPQVKQATFSTPPGHASDFEPTDDGGFIIFVEKLLPIDQTALNADLPQYLAELRSERQREVFNQWVDREANRELRNTPIFQQLAAGGR